jgi:hypothetical protein
MTRLMFASCMNHDHDVRGKVWQQALAHKPAWLFLIGDNVYMDWGDLLRQSPNLSVDEFARDLFARYDKQLQQQNFRTLVESIPAGQVHGTWDDHDFGWNDCFGASAANGMPDKRRVSRALFHHYFAHLNQRPLPPRLAPMSAAQALASALSGREVYQSLQIDGYRILITDGRFYREEKTQGNPSPSMLGQAQEAWLLQQLAGPNVPTLLVSGSTMTNGKDQSWDYHHAFFVQFLAAASNRKLIFIGGDVHENRLIHHPGTSICEVTTSGAGLGWVGGFANKRNFCIMDLKPDVAEIYLIRKTRVQLSASYDLASARTTHVYDVDNEAEDIEVTVHNAASSRVQARKKQKKLPTKKKLFK